MLATSTSSTLLESVMISTTLTEIVRLFSTNDISENLHGYTLYIDRCVTGSETLPTFRNAADSQPNQAKPRGA